jgi:hypothetical protein
MRARSPSSSSSDESESSAITSSAAGCDSGAHGSRDPPSDARRTRSRGSTNPSPPWTARCCSTPTDTVSLRVREWCPREERLDADRRDRLASRAYRYSRWASRSTSASYSRSRALAASRPVSTLGDGERSRGRDLRSALPEPEALRTMGVKPPIPPMEGKRAELGVLGGVAQWMGISVASARPRKEWTDCERREVRPREEREEPAAASSSDIPEAGVLVSSSSLHSESLPSSSEAPRSARSAALSIARSTRTSVMMDEPSSVRVYEMKGRGRESARSDACAARLGLLLPPKLPARLERLRRSNASAASSAFLPRARSRASTERSGHTRSLRSRSDNDASTSAERPMQASGDDNTVISATGGVSAGVSALAARSACLELTRAAVSGEMSTERRRVGGGRMGSQFPNVSYSHGVC